MKNLFEFVKDYSKEVWWKITNWWVVNDLKYWSVFFLFASMGCFIVYHFASNRHNVIGPASLDMKPTIIYKDKNGNERSNITGIIVSEDEFKRVTDSFKTLLQDKRAAIQEVTKYVNTVDTVFKKIYIKVDTSGNFEYSHSDNYIDLKAYGNYRTKEGNFHLRGIDTITHISYIKKHWFRSNEVKVNLSNSSPYYTVTEGASISLKEPKAIVTFGPQVGVSYINNKVRPYIGVGLTYNFLSIHTRR